MLDEVGVSQKRPVLIPCRTLTRQTIAALYNLAEEQITTFTLFEPALTIKFAIRRSAPAGGPGDSDIASKMDRSLT